MLSQLTVLPNVTSVALTLQWQLDRTGGHTIIGYSVYYRNYTDTSSSFILYQGNITNNAETVTGLNASTSYEFKVEVLSSNPDTDKDSDSDTEMASTLGNDLIICYTCYFFERWFHSCHVLATQIWRCTKLQSAT